MPIISYEIGKSYPLRNGGRAVIGYVFENGNAYAMYSNDAAQDYVCPITFLPDGRAEHGPMAFDILPPEPETMACWPNIYKVPNDGGLYICGRLHATKAEADENAMPDRVGCHRITLRAEFEEDAP